jgi:hypothetical protein
VSVEVAGACLFWEEVGRARWLTGLLLLLLVPQLHVSLFSRCLTMCRAWA